MASSTISQLQGTSIGNQGITLGDVENGFIGSLSDSEQALNQILQEIAGKADVSSADLLSMQVVVERWEIFQELESAIVKALGDTLKNVIQKVG